MRWLARFSFALLLLLIAWPLEAEDLTTRLGLKLKVVVQGDNKPVLVITPKENVKRFEARLFRDGSQQTVTVEGVRTGDTRTVGFEHPKKTTAEYKAVLAVEWEGGEKSELRMAFTVKSGDAFTMTINPNEVDLDGRTLTFKLSGPGKRAELRAFDAAHKELELVHKDLAGAAAGTPFVMSWQPQKSELAYLKVRAWDENGFWTETTLTPVSVRIPHQEVEFDFGKSNIRPSEEPKLDDTLEKIKQALALQGQAIGMRLYIAGYTDTVGSPESNRRLSADRARAIGRWFRQKGLGVPILTQGFGEDVLAVPTPDETREAANRRATYLLATHTPPVSAELPKQDWQGI